MMKYIMILFMLIFLVACSSDSEEDTNSDNNAIVVNEDDNTTTSAEENNITKAQLGEMFFNDKNLSLTRNMSCATCHNPDHAFIDTRVNNVNRAVSLGDDNVSLGDRNSPTIGYAHFTPTFTQINNNNFQGGLFFDGRSATLTEQAKGPFLNSVEMQMPDESSVVSRIQENGDYVDAMKNIYGEAIFDNVTNAYEALGDAIASFENNTTVFSPFDSDFDNNTLNAAATRGRNLFRSNAINCARCHNDRPEDNRLFTNFEYENLGIPINTTVRNLNLHATDLGLAEHPNVNGAQQNGKFKVSSLRNIAVTGPYMHNGVFNNLKTVVHFYNTRDVTGAINPETNTTWRAAEVNNNIVTNDVGNLGLTDTQEDDIVEFLKALTDAKYKHLIP